MAQSGRDAVELVAADDNHLERGDVGETLREVRQVVLMYEQGDQLLQPAVTHTSLYKCIHTLSLWLFECIFV